MGQLAFVGCFLGCDCRRTAREGIGKHVAGQVGREEDGVLVWLVVTGKDHATDPFGCLVDCKRRYFFHRCCVSTVALVTCVSRKGGTRNAINEELLGLTCHGTVYGTSIVAITAHNDTRHGLNLLEWYGRRSAATLGSSAGYLIC